MPPAPRSWLPDEDAIIRRMRESGATWDAITLALANVGAPMERQAVINRAQIIGMIEPNRRTVRRDKLSAEIIAQRKTGKRNHEIAVELGMTPEQINYRVRVLLECGMLAPQSPGPRPRGYDPRYD